MTEDDSKKQMREAIKDAIELAGVRDLETYYCSQNVAPTAIALVACELFRDRKKERD